MTSDTGDWTGNIWDFFTYVSNRIFLLGEKPLRVEGFARVDDNDLIKAQREMIANALIHADYHGRRGVVVERRPDRLTTMNPGSFRVPIDQAVRGGRSDPRNPTVMKMLMLTGMVERAGSGMSVIMGACRELGAGTPKFTEETDPDTVTCTMPISPSSSGCVTERVLSMIVRDSKASINSMSDALGVPRSEVVGAVNALKADGVLRREGGTRGSWRIGAKSKLPAGVVPISSACVAGRLSSWERRCGRTVCGWQRSTSTERSWPNGRSMILSCPTMRRRSKTFVTGSKPLRRQPVWNDRSGSARGSAWKGMWTG